MMAAGAAILVLIMGAVYLMMRPKAGNGTKDITVEVKAETGEVKTYQIRTDAQYLAGVLDELAKTQDFTYETQNGDYGLYIVSINGLTADYSVSQAYWSIYVNDAYGNYGISEQPVNDHDRFTLAYEK